MKQVFSVSLSEDLSEFTQFLWQQKIPHRVVEREDSQELWVAHTVDAALILKLYELWQNGHDLNNYQITSNSPSKSAFSRTLKQAPITAAVLIASLLISLITGFGANISTLSYFTFTDIFIQGENLYTRGLLYNVESLQIWRFLTPILIHFGAAHFIFNALWVWIVGTRMEIMQGYKLLLGLVVFSGLLSNFAQYWVSGPMFGGLSGVVFGLLGYAWLWDKLNPTQRFGLPSALMGFLLFWLVLGYTGALDSLGFGAIANTAHLVGLVVGLLYAPIALLITRR